MTTPTDPTTEQLRVMAEMLRATAALVRESTRLLRRTARPAKPGATHQGGTQ